MAELDALLDKLERLLEQLDALDEPERGQVFELLDGIDVLHRSALRELANRLGPDQIHELRRAHPAIAWLFDAYAVGIDELAEANRALEPILPYIHSHGGRVEVLDAVGGVVTLQMSGACSGCTASAVTLKEGIESALRDNFPGFVRCVVEEEEAPPHPPPGPTLLQIQRPPR